MKSKSPPHSFFRRIVLLRRTVLLRADDEAMSSVIFRLDVCRRFTFARIKLGSPVWWPAHDNERNGKGKASGLLRAL